jgi:hypothetical protein
MRTNFSEFLSRYSSIEECEFLDIVAELDAVSANGPWIAGGAVRRTLIGQLLESDIDVFFRDEQQREQFKSRLIADFDAKLIKSTDYHETYSAMIADERREVQLMRIAYYDSPEDVIDTFDFTITQFAFDGTDLISGEYSLWDLARKRLALHKLSYGVATMRRLIKYTKQGFTACAGCMQSILDSAVADPSVIRSDIQYVD